MYSEYCIWRKEGIQERDGVLVASDIGSEWLLPWWWDHYSKHNSHPVAFVDFGMSREMKEWCQERGETIRLRVADVFVAEEEEIEESLALVWRQNSEERFWRKRSAWFKKPLACLQSPFRRTLWVDLDCEIRGQVAPCFAFANSANGFALHKQPRGSLLYNSGVIPFKHGLPLFETWAGECLEKTDRFRGDQEVLSHLIAKEKLDVHALPIEMNWGYSYGENPNALIIHWWGIGQESIRHQMAAKLSIPKE